jgi:hypothetical protein
MQVDTEGCLILMPQKNKKNFSMFSLHSFWHRCKLFSWNKTWFKHFTLLNGIVFCQVVSDCKNQMITLFDLPFPLNDASFRKPDLLKRSKLITLSRIPLSSAHCMINALLMSMPFPWFLEWLDAFLWLLLASATTICIALWCLTLTCFE